jgi:hypothetical protein
MSDNSTVQPEWVGIDHVQLATPVGAEDEARGIYVDVLGLVEAHNLDVVWNIEIEGLTRCHVDDSFGNRIELVQVDGDVTH